MAARRRTSRRATGAHRTRRSDGATRGEEPDPTEQAPTWTFLSNHAHVLISLAAEPMLPLRDVAQRVGITERSVQRIVSELETGGYLVRTREGRCNRYTLRKTQPLRHPIEMHRRVGDLIEMVLTR